MHHYKQSKKQIAVRFFSYGVLSLSVIVLSIIGILVVLGYQFDFTHNSLEQTALVQFRSSPSNAAVTVDTKTLGAKTGTRTNVTGGSHTATMTLDGYRNWSKTFSVNGGTVLWLNYALLVPTNLKTTDIRELDATLTSDQTSPDKKWRIFTSGERTQAVTLANLTDPLKPTLSTYSVDSGVLTKADDGSIGSLTAVSWDSGSRYVLVKHTYGQATEYLRFDRQNPNDVRNISTSLGITDIAKIAFSDSSGNTYYALAGGDIRKLDLGNGTISQPLVTDVTQLYYPDGSETLAYVRIKDGLTSVGVYRDAGALVTTNTYASAPKDLLVSYGEYYGYRYMATYHDGNMYLIRDPDTRSPKLIKTVPVAAAQYLTFGPNGRMLVAQNGNAFTTYDIEIGATYNGMLGAADGATKLTWLDDYHLTTATGGTATFSEFDGLNTQSLLPARAASGIELSNNGENLFTIGTDAVGKPVLQRTSLRVSQ